MYNDMASPLIAKNHYTAHYKTIKWRRKLKFIKSLFLIYPPVIGFADCKGYTKINQSAQTLYK